MNAHLRYRITSRVSLVAHARNLGDTHCETFGALGDAEWLGEDFDDPRFVSTGAPRAGWAGLDVRF